MVCSNTLIYAQKEGEKELHLISFNSFHLHTKDRNKYVTFLSNKGSRFVTLMRKAFARRPYRQENSIEGAHQSQLIYFLEFLPPSLNQMSKFMIMHNNFKIDHDHFKFLTGLINHKKELSFFELIDWLKNRNYTYSHLPESLPFLDHYYKKTTKNEP